jgi:ubiquinone/menaquinone biosynthesis C-methylase UbiE
LILIKPLKKLIKTLKEYIGHQIFSSPVKEREVVEAYDLWSADYDSQPGNLMLDLDEILFSNLLAGINIKNRTVADIGCGTGRHWAKILKEQPESLTGFDVSPGMLRKLKDKFPAAQTYTIADNNFSNIEEHTFDVILSTLTVAHIKNIEEALDAWSRVLKLDGDIIITDFHPDALAFGGKRTFKHQKTQIAVKNFVHSLDAIGSIMRRNGFSQMCSYERKIDESVKHYYTAKNATPVYEKFKGFPVIYGMHFKRIG